METRILLLAALVAGALAGPINVRYDSDDTKCARRCTESSKFRYQPGTTYEFDYFVQTQSALDGASEDHTALGIKATAHIEVLSKCELALLLRNVRVFESEPSMALHDVEATEFRRALEAHPLRFSFQDGAIEDLCAADDESPRVLNIKRGVLSTFQNSMDSLETEQSVHEADVTGKCLTEYKTAKSWYTTTITKSKNLTGCMDRQDYRSVIQAMPYRVSSEIQSLPLMNSEHSCTQEIDNANAYMKSVLCKERHSFRPFSHGKSGAITAILQKLTYKTQRQGITARPELVSRRENMFYEHARTQASSSMQRREVESKLQHICQMTKTDIRPESPMLFSELVHLLRNLDTSSMRAVYRQITSGSICSENQERTKKFFLDAIPMVSTSSSVEMMKELLINKEITGITADMWVKTLTFIQAPTRDMLIHAKSILEMNAMQDDAMLPVSALVNNFCMRTESCADVMEVSDIISVFERIIGSGCYIRDRNLEKALLTLRAIGNAGNSNTIGSRILSSCFSRSSNPMEIRVAALDAYRRLPCSADRSEPMSVFRDRSEDSELRIAAYLAVMRCPSEDVLSVVKSTLESEDANQVGSFVWSHLTNLMESSNPHKQNIRFILEDARLKKEFNMEKLKYSRNYEGSFMLERLNTGAMVESNIIWSSKSFIPRSANLNLTIDLFGNSINLMDMGGRIEGLEYMLETYLGPLGYFGEKTTSRSLAKSKAKLDELRGSLYMRMFGNEMAFTHFKGMDSFPKMKSYNQRDLLKELSGKHDLSFTQNIMFLDSSIIVPTSAGLPLNLTVNGVATVDMQAEGEVDIKKIFASPSQLQISGSVRPSAAVAITGHMTVDAFVTKSGMRMTSTLHTSTSTVGNIMLHNGKILKVEFDMPQDKMEIMDVKTAFYIIHGDNEKEQKMITDNRKSAKVCTGSHLAKISGLELCGEVSFPNASMKAEAPYFPFTGPVTASIMLHKRDSHVGYRLLLKKTRSNSVSILQLALDTPGSKVDRDMSFDFILNNKEMSVNMKSPWMSAATKGSLTVKGENRDFNGYVSYNNAKVLTINADGKVMRDGNRITYQPNIVVSRPGQDKYRLDGKVTMEDTETLLVDLTMDPSKGKKMNFKVSATNKRGEKSVSGSANYGYGDYAVIASLLHEMGKKMSFKLVPNFELKTPSSTVASVSGSCEYKSGKALMADMSVAVEAWMKKPIIFKSNVNRLQRRNGQVKYVADINVNSKIITAKIDGFMDYKKSGSVASRLIVDYNMPKFKKNKITLNSKYLDRSKGRLTKIEWNTIFDVKRNPEFNFNSKIDLSHNERHTESGIELSYGTDKNNYFLADGSVDHKLSMAAASVAMKGKLIVKPLDVDVKVNGNHKHSGRDLDSTMEMIYGKDKAIVTGLRLKDDTKKTTKMGGEFNLAYPGNKIVISSGLAQSSKKEMQHTINMNLGGEHKSSIVSTYRRPRLESHEITSEINLHGMKPLILTGESNFNLKNFKIGGSVKHAGNVYSTQASSKYSPSEPRGKLILDVLYPTRHVIISMDGGKDGTKYSGNLDTKWDADADRSQAVVLNGDVNLKSLQDMDGSITMKYPSQTLVLNMKHRGNDKYISHADFSWSGRNKIEVDTSFGHFANSAERNIATTLSVSTPFEILPKLVAEVSYNSDASKYNTNSMLTWGSGQRITSNLSVMKPLSLERIDMSWRGTTPFNNFRKMNAEIVHNAAGRIDSVVRGTIGSTRAEVKMTGEDRSSYYTTDKQGKIELISNIPEFESMSAEGKVMFGNNKYQSNMVMDRNGDKYLYDLDMTMVTSGWQMQSNGNLVVSIPSIRLSNNWNHRHTTNDIKSTLTSEWGRRNKIFVDLSARDESASTRKLSGELKIQSPWEVLRDVELNSNTEIGSQFASNTWSLRNNRNEVATHNFNYRMGENEGEMDFALTNPYTENINGKMNIRANAYPITGRAEFSWAPSKVVAVDGSFTNEATYDIDTTLRVTTPFEMMPSVILKATNKHIDGRMILSTANMEYGARKSIDLDSRIRYDDIKEITIKLNTPHPDFRSIDTHLSYAGSLEEVDGKLELEIVPVFGKFSSMLNAKWASDMAAKFRMDTPCTYFPYLQIDAVSSEDATGRHSRIEAEYSPRQMVSLVSSYKMDGLIPAMFDISLTSPYENLENVGATMTHKHKDQSMQSHAEVRYAPYKMVEGDWTLNWFKDLNALLVVKTPFENYEHTKLSYRHDGELKDFSSHAEIEALKQKMDADLSVSLGRKQSAKFILHTPFEGLEEFKAAAEMRGRLERMRLWTTINYGDSKEIQAVLRNAISGERLDTNFQLKTPFFDNFKLSIDHDGNLQRFTNKFHSSLGRDYIIETDASMNIRLPSMDFTGKLDYRLPIENRVVTVSLHKDGEWDNMNVHASGVCNGAEVSVKGNFMARDVIESSLTIATPYHDDLVMSINHNGDLHRFSTKASMNLGSTYAASSETTFSVDLPVVDLSHFTNYRMDGNGKEISLISHVGGQWENLDWKVTTAVNNEEYSASGNLRTENPIEAAIIINSPIPEYREMTANFKHDGDMNRFTTSGSVQYMDGKRIESIVRFFANGLERIDASAVITTPFQDYEKTEYIYRQTMDDNTLSSHGEVQYGYSRKISADVNASIYPKMSGSIIVETPFVDYRTNRITVSHEGTMNDMKTVGEIELFGEKMNVAAEFTHNRDTTGKFVLMATSPDVKDIIFSFSKNGEWSDVVCAGTLKYGRETVANGKLNGRFIGDSSSLSINLQNPYTEDIDASFEHKGQMFNCRTTIDASVGKSTAVHGETTVRSSAREFEVSSDNSYTLSGVTEKANAFVKSVGDLMNRETTFGGRFAERSIDGSVSYNLNRGIEVDASLTTPFTNYRNLAFNLKHSGRSENFNTQSSLRYMDQQEVSAKLNFYRYMWNTLKSSLEINTPFESYEKTKMSYEHNLSDDVMSSEAVLTYGRRQKIASSAKVMMTPKYSIDINVETPFPGYESVVYSGSSSSRNQHHTAEASFKLGSSYKAYTVNADLNMNTSPMTGFLRMYTPISDLENVDISFSHDGSLENFRSVGSIETPMTGTVRGEANLAYTSPFVMDGSVSLNSALPHMEELMLTVRNSESGDEHRSHIELGWQPSQQITLDGGYKYSSGWYNKQYSGDFSLNTPFEAIRSVVLKTSSNKDNDKYTNKVEAEYNSETVLDVDSEYMSGEKHHGSITMNKPFTMQYTMGGLYNDAEMNGDVLINWNRDEPNSNIRLVVATEFGANKFMNVRMIHPTRTVAMKANFHKTNFQAKSEGEITWDEQLGRKIFYVFDVSDNSRGYKQMYDASAKLGLPSRTLQTRGSFSSTSSMKTIDTAFLWDAERDSSKMVGLKGNFMPSDNKHKADITISLPNNRQDIRIGTEMTVDSGRTLFDGKTEFSYSPDSRKTLVLTSNLKDVSYDRSHSNYSLSLGISHPYTYTDVEVTSHIGSSSEKYASGMQMKYLTASRKRINLSLLGDIDRLRRQINLQVVSPLENIQVSGEVKSMKPYQVVLNSRINGEPAALAAMSLDTEAKAFRFESNYDMNDFSKMFHIDAEFVNSSAISGEVYLDGRSHNTKSQMSVLLRDSRILQSELSWRPEMFSEAQYHIGGQWRRASSDMASLFEKVVESVGTEVAYKYRAIAGAIEEEVSPIVEMVMRELRDFEGYLISYSDYLRGLHSENFWYIQSMGDYAVQTLLSAIESYRSAVDSFRTYYTEMMTAITQYLEDMKSYPIRERYYAIIDSMVEEYKDVVLMGMEQTSEALDAITEYLREYYNMYNEYSNSVQESLSESMENVINHPHVDYVRSKIHEIRAVDWMGNLKNRISEMNIPEKYNTAIYSAREMVSQQLSDVMNRDEVKYVQARANEVYQQGKWAYAYWKVEENIEQKLTELLNLLREIVRDELKQYREEFSFLSRSKITEYEPSKGEIKAEIYLPFSMSSITDVDGVVEHVTEMMNEYVPSSTTMNRYYNDYVPTIWMNNTTPRGMKQRIQTSLRQ